MNPSFHLKEIELKKRAQPDPNVENRNQNNLENQEMNQDPKFGLRLKERRVLGELNMERRREKQDINAVKICQKEENMSIKKVKQEDTKKEENESMEESSGDSDGEAFFNQIKKNQIQFLESRNLLKNQIGW